MYSKWGLESITYDDYVCALTLPSRNQSTHPVHRDTESERFWIVYKSKYKNVALNYSFVKV